MQKDPPSDGGAHASAIDVGASLMAAGRSSRRRLVLASDAPAMQVRRILVLVARFQALCALKSDPARLCDLLRRLIACARETFIGEVTMPGAAGRGGRASPEQLQCLDDLELLMHAMIRHVPGASRELSHALDGLVVQCVLFEAGAVARLGDATRSGA